MDTLTLEGKEFISTKRAAEITGYAKDYIGQLCREGRIESRLIGRNWYILESSVREHRYGAESVKESELVPEESDVIEEEENITEEPVVEVPEEVSVTEEAPVMPNEPEKEDSEAIEEIQRAWQSWFSNRYVEETPRSLELSKETAPDTDSTEKTSQKAILEEEDTSSIRISRIADHVPSQTSSVPRTVSISMQRGHRVAPPHNYHQVPQERAEEPRKPLKQGKGRRLILESVFIAIAGLSLAVALVGVGALDAVPVENALQAQIMKYIGGSISF